MIKAVIKMKEIILEICCGSVDDVIVATKAGASRIELNHALELGGCTPTIGTLIESQKRTHLPLHCMVRPLAGGFVYSEAEYQSMLWDAKQLLEYGADGIVFGFLTLDNEVDVPRTLQMTQLIHQFDKEAVFHKAIDVVNDMEKSIQTLIQCKIDRILTEGGQHQGKILQGLSQLALLHQKYGSHIQILPGGGVRANNAHQILQETNIRQLHSSCKRAVPYHGQNTYVVDPQCVIELKQTLDAFKEK